MAENLVIFCSAHHRDTHVEVGVSLDLSGLKIPPCVPPAWANNGHLQTLLGHFLPSAVSLGEGERVEVPLEDGDRLVGRFYTGPSSIVVTLFHGLGGNIAMSYMRRTAQVCLALGHSVLLVNHRGCGEGKNFARNPYHAGRAEDLSDVLKWVHARHPQSKTLSIGFSLGGAALLLLLTGKRGSLLPDAAIAVNAPLDLEKTALRLKAGLNKGYDLSFILNRHLDTRDTPWVSSIYDFDAKVTAPRSEFPSREIYYKECSSLGGLKNVKTPTVLLISQDDPIVSFDEDYLGAEMSTSIHLHVEKAGGHLGYLTKDKTVMGNLRWMDYCLKRYVEALSQILRP